MPPAKTKETPSRAKNAEVVDSDEDDESEKEDCEIEAILEAKKGQFKNPQKLGYYVKWKGYDDTHNSWVMEHEWAQTKWTWLKILSCPSSER
ncbi:hypothetical protein B0H14DRAFT_3440979 [Mycena olivaceomarginata]|nr:hypothetical protein B0H14DRAFT_3440979 [Mycena olivaceomarginata]